jgi:hypothetical protein
MEVPSQAVARVPGENLRVSRTEFGALWVMVERLTGRPGPDDDFLIGVLRTCRWLAGQPVRSAGLARAEMPSAPITRRSHIAMPETVEAELVAAAAAAGRCRGRPDLARGVVTTLEWAWRGTGAPPLDVLATEAS